MHTSPSSFLFFLPSSQVLPPYELQKRTYFSNGKRSKNRVRLEVIATWVGLQIYRNILWDLKFVEGKNLLVIFTIFWNNYSTSWNLITIIPNLSYYVPLFTTITDSSLCCLILLSGHFLVFFLIIFTPNQRALFQTPIFNILNGLTGISRRSINGYAKQAIYPHSVPNFTLYLHRCLTRARITQLRCLGALGWWPHIPPRSPHRTTHCASNPSRGSLTRDLFI